LTGTRTTSARIRTIEPRAPMANDAPIPDPHDDELYPRYLVTCAALGARDPELVLLQHCNDLLDTESLSLHGFPPSFRQVSLPENSPQVWTRFRGAAQHPRN
jgi:hypothetical protein